MHIHIGVLSAIIIFLNVIVVGFLWRMAAMYFANSPIGQAMAFIY